MSKSKGKIDEPNMSDSALLVRVDDLINIAMGPPDKNIVNFKMVQTILHILARQMRMLEQQVEIRIAEITPSLSGSEIFSADAMRGGKAGGADAQRSVTGKSPRRRGEDGEKDKEAQREKRKSRADGLHGREEDRDGGRERAKDRDRDKDGRDRGKDRDAADSEGRKDRERTDKPTRDKDGEDRYRSEGALSRDGKGPGKGDKRKGKDKRDKDDKDRDYDERDTETRGGKDRGKEQGGRDKDLSEKDRDIDYGESEKGGRADRDRGEREKGRSADRDRGEREKGRSADRDRGEKEKGRPADIERGEREKGKPAERDRGEREKGGRAEKDRDGDRGERDKAKPRTASGTSITISEIERDKEKILVVEKGPTTRKQAGRPRLGSLELVTRSQFRILEDAVEDLTKKAKPVPAPTLPDNKKLRLDLARGSASLTDTMQAMQVAARIQAAEKAIEMMADMLTQLAASGALPQDIAGKAADLRQDFQDIRQEAGGTAPYAAPSAAPSAPSPMQEKLEAKKRGGPPDRKSISIEPHKLSSYPGAGASRPSEAIAMGTPLRASMLTPSVQRSTAATEPLPCVTHEELDSRAVREPLASSSQATRELRIRGAFVRCGRTLSDALRELRAELSMNMGNMTARATQAAENAALTAKGVADKLNIAVGIDRRISTLFGLVADYSEQLNGFDAGLTTQMQGFQEQMAMMRSDLAGGLNLLEQVNNNAETAAVLELTERYEALVQELDITLHAHQALTSFQKQLGDELRSLVECVEMMREQKADRDEVLDGLRDKADSSRLAGLLSEVEFEEARSELEMRLEMCNDKFRRQDAVWMEAVRDFANITDGKAELMQLLSVRDDAQRQLRELHEKVQCLARQLGEPKAAVLTRKLARDALCASCRAPALMSPRDAQHDAPPRLPPLRRERERDPATAPRGDHDLCLRDITGIAIGTGDQDQDLRDKTHVCQRWCGGSHTLVTDAVSRRAAPAPPATFAPPTRCYAGLGTDGRFYKFEEDLLPCAECNLLTPEKAPVESQEKIPGEADFLPRAVEDGAGDQGARRVTLIKDSDARRVTVINEENLRRASEEDYNIKPRQSNYSMVAKSRITMMLEEDHSIEIGNIVKGRVTVIDEEAARRATIVHDIAERRATIAEPSEKVEEEQNATDGATLVVSNRTSMKKE